MTRELVGTAASPGADSGPVRVIVAEDDLLVREGVIRLLVEAGHEVVASASDPERLLAAVAACAVDVCVIDIRMPPTHRDEGLVAARAIREHHPHVGVLVHSQFIDDAYAAELLAAGDSSVGYLLKDSLLSSSELINAVEQVASGAVVVDRRLVRDLLERSRAANDPLARLSARERDVLALMAEGCTDRAIADRLVVSIKTVESHAHAIFTKLDLTDDPMSNRRVRAVLSWLRS